MACSGGNDAERYLCRAPRREAAPRSVDGEGWRAMTMHTHPVAMRAPCRLCVGLFVGAAPEDRHAERIVREMLAFLGDLDQADAAAQTG